MLLTLIKKQIVTPEIWSFTFTSPEPVQFNPGQFVMLRQPNALPKYNRAFSIANAPNTKEITFLIKKIPNGHVSGYLETAAPGVSIEAGQPVGRFTLNPTDTDRVFVATGTGLAPIISFIESKPTIPFALLFGVRSETDLFWTEKLDTTKTTITLSQPSDVWTGARGRVTAHIDSTIKNHPEAAWYLCGSPDMVKEVRAQLLAHGVTATNIHFEIF